MRSAYRMLNVTGGIKVAGAGNLSISPHLLGAGLGAGVGGLAGSMYSDEDNQLGGALLGAGIGAGTGALGGEILSQLLSRYHNIKASTPAPKKAPEAAPAAPAAESKPSGETISSRAKEKSLKRLAPPSRKSDQPHKSKSAATISPALTGRAAGAFGMGPARRASAPRTAPVRPNKPLFSSSPVSRPSVSRGELRKGEQEHAATARETPTQSGGSGRHVAGTGVAMGADAPATPNPELTGQAGSTALFQNFNPPPMSAQMRSLKRLGTGPTTAQAAGSSWLSRMFGGGA